MKIIAINGSPRKKGNTATLLNHALEGAASQGADTEIIHLYDLNYKGCLSCFSCKLKNGKHYGKCIVKDDLMPIFKQVEEADAIILGSPIYVGSVTGEMKSFLDRLIFSHLEYDAEVSSLLDKKMLAGFIYTMDLDESGARSLGYFQHLGWFEGQIKRVFGSSESLFVYNTYMFDYSKYVAGYWDQVAKVKQRDEQFPIDCKKAFSMGVRFVTGTV